MIHVYIQKSVYTIDPSNITRSKIAFHEYFVIVIISYNYYHVINVIILLHYIILSLYYIILYNRISIVRIN